MKKKQFWINLAVYLIILLGALHLYFPFTNNPQNRSGSSIQFVYQQF
jgi:hypothetical protein